MKTKHILLCCLLCCLLVAACVQTFDAPRGYAYCMDEPKWTLERAAARTKLKHAWKDLTHPYCAYVFPDTILADSVIYDPRIVEGGEMHRIEYVRYGMQDHDYYYIDRKGMSVEVLQGVSVNNGQPYSLYDYFYIDTDGLVKFNLRKNVEMMLWCLNVLVSPWLWLVLFLFLIYIGLRLLWK